MDKLWTKWLASTSSTTVDKLWTERVGVIVEQAYDREAGPGRWLQAMGISAMVAAALATILFGTPAMPDRGTTDSSCRLDFVAQEWTGSSCDDVAAESAGR